MSEEKASALQRVAARDFPGFGTAEKLDYSEAAPVKLHSLGTGAPHKLGQWKATAICGNDITSSCLYVSALAALYAGPYAPVALAMVAGVLYLFRSIYAEVGTALPLNGGAYNVLLNTTTKAKAALAACLTLLSYVATAVISANEAMHYAHNLWPGIPVMEATLALLAAFALLTLFGITESSIVALAIFIFHIGTLTVLIFPSAWAILQDSSTLAANWGVAPPGGMQKALFFGFAAAMLGISGFESSANFIEEQKDGVFPKTLRNMWIAVALFNPLISVLAMGLVPLAEISQHKQDLLAWMGLQTAGPWLQKMVSVDAVLVLSGAVLTSYVGVTGLVRRMSLDRCLPQVLLSENRWRGTNHWIILLFLALSSSILLISAGRIETLAGVYTLSFLGVMALFAVGNMLLKVKRARLPRSERASWLGVAVGFLAVCLAAVGNLMLNPKEVRVFVIYLAAAIFVVGIMFVRVQLLRIVLAAMRAVVSTVLRATRQITGTLNEHIDEINNFQIIYFSKGDNLAALNRAALYVLQNEQTTRLKVVHCYSGDEAIPDTLVEQLKTIDQVYPHIRIDLLLVRGKFGPELIERLSQDLGVPKNYMFIGTPGDQFPHRLADLGGVRLIM